MPYNTQESLLIKRAKVNKNTQEDSLIQNERRPITLKGKKGKEHLAQGGISQERGEKRQEEEGEKRGKEKKRGRRHKCEAGERKKKNPPGQGSFAQEERWEQMPEQEGEILSHYRDYTTV